MSNIKSINNKITYRRVGDYLIPNIELSAEEKDIQIGIWGCGSPVAIFKPKA